MKSGNADALRRLVLDFEKLPTTETLSMARITSSFDSHSTASDVVANVDLTGRRVVITGGASGIGMESARAFASVGAQVTLAVRNIDAARPVADAICRTTGNLQIDVQFLDLARRDSIAEFVGRWHGPLHILVNNAGVMALPTLQRSAEGWEMQFATNFLGHFALTLGLHHALAMAEGARIVSLSSSGHQLCPVLFDDMHFQFVPYDPLLAYGQSKSATALFAVAATNHWKNDGITANAVMPGAISTNLQRHTGGLRTPIERRKSPQQGAATTLFVATSHQLQGIGGRYFEDSNEAQIVSHRTPDYTGVAPYALDDGNAERLWEVSSALLR